MILTNLKRVKLKYLITQINCMCEMIDEIEIEHLRLARARKETNPQPEEEKPLAAVAQ